MSRWSVPLMVGAALFAALPGAAAASGPDPLYEGHGEVRPFRLTDQSGRTVTADDLRGKVWVASFFFSTCTECNRSTIQQLRRLQEEFAAWPDVRLVSFTVDPERDTPEQLGAFAEQLQIDPNRWLLLTGPQGEMYDVIQKGFQVAVGPSPEPKPGAEIIHSFRFVLVDSHGKVRGSADGQDPAAVDRLAARAKELVLAKYFPTLNASLNALAGVLLVAGYLAVRRRRITIHKLCMVSALVVSALFLACYLYYHLIIQRGQPTLFTGQGVVRYVYFAILGSHTVLAVIVTPLALTSAYLGWRNRLKAHVAIARWTLPLWLYVSVTGVVVYVMLYHLYPPG